MTVTYLVPVFGMLWGALYLSEPISPRMLVGAAVILAGTTLVTRGPAEPLPASSPGELHARAS